MSRSDPRLPKPTKTTGSPKKSPGRPAEPLVIPGNWKDAVKQAMAKGKPPAKKAATKKRRPKK
jgi:hypothetical protein